MRFSKLVYVQIVGNNPKKLTTMVFMFCLCQQIAELFLSQITCFFNLLVFVLICQSLCWYHFLRSGCAILLQFFVCLCLCGVWSIKGNILPFFENTLAKQMLFLSTWQIQFVPFIRCVCLKHERTWVFWKTGFSWSLCCCQQYWPCKQSDKLCKRGTFLVCGCFTCFSC